MRIKVLFDLWLSLPFYLLILLKHFDVRKKQIWHKNRDFYYYECIFA